MTSGHKGGRHVADILGASVYVGDQVVAMSLAYLSVLARPCRPLERALERLEAVLK
jgi:hypothetical protein